MTNQDQDRDQAVMSYVRGRMPQDMPPDFVSSVMHEVYNTPQRRSWSGWQILAGAATMAAGVAVVAIGLSYVRPMNVGTDPSATATPTAEATRTPEPVAPSRTPDPDATPTPLPADPAWVQSPEEAFGADVQTCEKPAGEPGAPDENWRYLISFPGDWYSNPAGMYAFGDIGVEREECRLFGPEPFDPNYGSADNAGVIVEIVSGEIGIGGTVVSRTEYTVGDSVNGRAAVRFETVPDPDGLVETDPTVTWIIAAGGELPSESSEGQGTTVFSYPEPWMMISSSSADPAEFAEFVEVLDRMIATLEFLEP